jgi:hypothetical protein
VIAPRSPLPVVAPNYGEGTVSVVVRNLDGSGDPIAGESAAASGAYRYQRVQLALESEFTRANRSILRELRLQVITNVVSTPHTDYDPDASNLLNEVGLAEVPGIALLGPDLVENRFYSLNAWQRSASAGERAIRRAPYTVDLAYTIVGICNHKVMSLNLMAVVQGFFERNKQLFIDRDPDDASKGQVGYTMDLDSDGDMKADHTPSNSNLRIFSGRFSVRGFDIEGLTGLDNQVVARTADTTEVNVGIIQVPVEVAAPVEVPDGVLAINGVPIVINGKFQRAA